MKVAHVSCRLLVLRVSGEDVVDVLGEGNGVVGTREEIRVVVVLGREEFRVVGG